MCFQKKLCRAEVRSLHRVCDGQPIAVFTVQSNGLYNNALKSTTIKTSILFVVPCVVFVSFF